MPRGRRKGNDGYVVLFGVPTGGGDQPVEPTQRAYNEFIKLADQVVAKAQEGAQVGYEDRRELEALYRAARESLNLHEQRDAERMANNLEMRQKKLAALISPPKPRVTRYRGRY